MFFVNKYALKDVVVVSLPKSADIDGIIVNDPFILCLKILTEM
jgi:hypothetical protein